jgi:lipoprotein-anchoring transpeptidase ErfK/SrfK
MPLRRRRAPMHVSSAALALAIVLTIIPSLLRAQAYPPAGASHAAQDIALAREGDAAPSTRPVVSRETGARVTGVREKASAFVADRMVIEKSERRMTLYAGGEAMRTYRISLGFAPVGDKQQRGDGRTPEGTFRIDWANPDSRYHLSLHISYPDATHLARARSRGLSPGGDIMIHGLPNGVDDATAAHPERDWTDGCIAVSNAAMDEIWRRVPVGTVVEIRP